MSKKEVDDLRSAAHQHWLKFQELTKRSNDIAFKDKLDALGWNIGDDLTRVWKGSIQKVQVAGRDQSTGIMATKYKLDGDLSVVTVRLYENEGWELVKK